MTINAQEELNRLLLMHNFEDFELKQAMDHIAQIVDAACEVNSEDGLIRAQSLIEKLQEKALSSEEQVELFYFMANSWGALLRVRHSSTKPSFRWEIEEFEKEIVTLRKAIKHQGFEGLPKGRRLQIYTNLANCLSEIGRPIEAIRVYDIALSVVKKYGMAQGGKGICLDKYASHLYDDGHACVLYHAAYDLLKEAALSKSTEEHARAPFRNYVKRLSKNCTEYLEPKFYDRDLGKSKIERKYREWCLKERLFLNPLNDLGLHSLAVRDVFGMPAMITKVSEGANPPKYFKYYNMLKQEYVSARYLFFEGLNQDRAHFSDRNVLIYNTLDYSSHSLAMERIKLAYRSAYSLLDKVSYFIKEYFCIDIPDERVYFKSIWYKNADKNQGLREIFEKSENWALRGLFWLSKDLFERGPDFKNSIEPDAEHLYDLRNGLEHRFLKLYQMKHTSAGAVDAGKSDLTEDEFEAKAYTVFRLAREALIYLSLAINREEFRRSETAPPALTMPMDVPTLEDHWKRRW